LDGRLFGFLLGTAAAGAGMYYYVLGEYRVSNELLTEDIYVCYPPPSFAQLHSDIMVDWKISAMLSLIGTLGDPAVSMPKLARISRYDQDVHHQLLLRVLRDVS
jgi:hypothetical protein